MNWSTRKLNKIKNSHVLIVGAGYSLSTHGDVIKQFVKKKNPITIGCNYVSNFMAPYFHLWGDERRYKKFGRYTHEKSIPVFNSSVFSSSYLKKEGVKKFIYLFHKDPKHLKKIKKSIPQGSKLSEDQKNKSRKIIVYKNKIIYARFRTIGCLAIIWSHLLKASRISIIGMDGYTLYNKQQYDNGSVRQHFYIEDGKKVNYEKVHAKKYSGTGYTDIITGYASNIGMDSKRKSKENFYNYCVEKDQEIYSDLQRLQDFGVNFNILTPTVYDKFYNSNILKLEE